MYLNKLSKSCTLEAHAFAEASDDFKKLGATIVGVTAGNVDQVDEFSKLECRDKFAVAADPGAKVAGEYKTLMESCSSRAMVARSSITMSCCCFSWCLSSASVAVNCSTRVSTSCC
jgi:peroxiredoxin